MNKFGKIKICTFLHYSTSVELPYYVRIYIEELSNYFDKVIVLSNNANLQKQDLNISENIQFKYFENLGYDFGLFYRFITTQNLDDFSQIAIVNDSNILINNLDNIFNWSENNNSDFWGLIDSLEKPWFSTHTQNYHIQSHFIVLNEKAIKCLTDFFASVNISEIFNEKDLKKLRRQIINEWEIGLSQYLIKQELKPSTFIKSKNVCLKYKSKKKNIAHSLFHKLIAKENYPLLKKKIVTKKRKWYLYKEISWKETILKHGNLEWNLEKIINDEY